MKIINTTNLRELELKDEFFKVVDILSDDIDFFKSMRYYPYEVEESSSGILKVAHQLRDINESTDDFIYSYPAWDTSPFIRDICSDLIVYKYTCKRLINLLEKFVNECE